MASKSPKSYRVGVSLPIHGRGNEAPPPSPCRVSHAHFPDPTEALALGWSPAQIIDGCRRCPRDELTPKLQQRLLAAGLTPAQIGTLFRFSRAQIRSVRAVPWEQQTDENVIEKPREENEDMGDPLTFAKALVIGMPARKALEESLPSTTKDITKELLQACVDGGLSSSEIAQGFGVSRANLYNICSKFRFKFSKRQSAEEPGRGAGEDGAAGGGEGGAGDGGQPPGAVAGEEVAKALQAILERDAEQAKASSVFTPLPADPGAAHTPTAEELADLMGAGGQPGPKAGDAPTPADEWPFSFGVSRPEAGPLLTIYADGRILIRQLPLPTNTLYVFKFNADLTRCRIEKSPEGTKVRAKDNEGIEGRLRRMADKLVEVGLKLPARYRLDPQTLIGERVG